MGALLLTLMNCALYGRGMEFFNWGNLMKFWFYSSAESSVFACSKKHKRQQKEQLGSGNKMVLFLRLLAGNLLSFCWNRHCSASVGAAHRDAVTCVSNMLLFYKLLFFAGSIG